MLHIFILPACSILVNLKHLNDGVPYNFTAGESKGLFTGKVYMISIRPESVALN